jgi:hypothetical protein
MPISPHSIPDPSIEQKQLTEAGAPHRYPCVRSTTVRLLARPSFQSYRASVNDVSIREIGLIVERSFELGTVLAILLQTEHAGLSGILSATVRQAMPRSDGYWLLDCSLSRCLTDDEVSALL